MNGPKIFGPAPKIVRTCFGETDTEKYAYFWSIAAWFIFGPRNFGPALCHTHFSARQKFSALLNKIIRTFSGHTGIFGPFPWPDLCFRAKNFDTARPNTSAIGSGNPYPLRGEFRGQNFQGFRGLCDWGPLTLIAIYIEPDIIVFAIFSHFYAMIFSVFNPKISFWG